MASSAIAGPALAFLQTTLNNPNIKPQEYFVERSDMWADQFHSMIMKAKGHSRLIAVANMAQLCTPQCSADGGSETSYCCSYAQRQCSVGCFMPAFKDFVQVRLVPFMLLSKDIRRST